MTIPPSGSRPLARPGARSPKMRTSGLIRERRIKAVPAADVERDAVIGDLQLPGSRNDRGMTGNHRKRVVFDGDKCAALSFQRFDVGLGDVRYAQASLL